MRGFGWIPRVGKYVKDHPVKATGYFLGGTAALAGIGFGTNYLLKREPSQSLGENKEVVYHMSEKELTAVKNEAVADILSYLNGAGVLSNQTELDAQGKTNVYVIPLVVNEDGSYKIMDSKTPGNLEVNPVITDNNNAPRDLEVNTSQIGNNNKSEVSIEGNKTIINNPDNSWVGPVVTAGLDILKQLGIIDATVDVSVGSETPTQTIENCGDVVDFWLDSPQEVQATLNALGKVQGYDQPTIRRAQGLLQTALATVRDAQYNSNPFIMYFEDNTGEQNNVVVGIGDRFPNPYQINNAVNEIPNPEDVWTSVDNCTIQAIRAAIGAAGLW